jgi:hypothetical protein
MRSELAPVLMKYTKAKTQLKTLLHPIPPFYAFAGWLT